MKSLISGLAVVAVGLMWAGLTASAQTQSVQVLSQKVAAATPGTRQIVVSLEDRKLALVEAGSLAKSRRCPGRDGRGATPACARTFRRAIRLISDCRRQNPTLAGAREWADGHACEH